METRTRGWNLVARGLHKSVGCSMKYYLHSSFKKKESQKSGKADGYWGDKSSPRYTLISLWRKLGLPNLALEPRSWNTSKLRGSRTLLASSALAHWSFAFLPCSRCQEAKKGILALVRGTDKWWWSWLSQERPKAFGRSHEWACMGARPPWSASLPTEGLGALSFQRGPWSPPIGRCYTPKTQGGRAYKACYSKRKHPRTKFFWVCHCLCDQA